MDVSGPGSHSLATMAVDAVGIAVLRKAMSADEQVMSQLIASMPPPPSLDPAVGGNLDLFL